jgi:hypothetical protein
VITKVTHVRSDKGQSTTGRLEVTLQFLCTHPKHAHSEPTRHTITTTCDDDGSFNSVLEPVVVFPELVTPIKTGFEAAFRALPKNAVMTEGKAKANVVGH